MEITLKEFKRKHKKECCHMIEQTWSFQELLCGVKDKKIIFKGFFETYLAQSHYRKVALNEKGEVLGYLLGKNRREKTFKIFIEQFLIKAIYLYYILIGKLGKRKQIFKLLKLQEKAYKEVIPPKEKFDSEIELFFVNEKARGLGVGRLLIKDYLKNYCEAKGLKNIVLFTDESSTYEFYEKYGFKRYKTTKYSKELRAVQGKRAFSYILCL